MKRSLLITAPLSLALVLAACVSTNIASFKDPKFRDASFGRILVIANYERFETVQKVESMVVEELQIQGAYAIPNHKLLPPLRTYTDDEKRDAFIGEKLDAYIIVSPVGVNNADLYLPSISSTRAKVSAYGDRISGSSTTVTTSGGKRNVVSSVDTQAELYEFQTGNIVWKGEANTEIHYNAYGQTFAGVDNVLRSFCFNIVDELQKNSLLKNK